MSAIVSVSTTGRRIGRIVEPIRSVLNGSLKPKRFILWLNESPSPVGPGTSISDVPRELGNMPVEVRWCENIGPATKLLHARKEFPDDLIATMDDDMIYPPLWLQKLVDAVGVFCGTTGASPACCYRAKMVTRNQDGTAKGYRNWSLVRGKQRGPNPAFVPTGVHGIIYPPGCFKDEVFNFDKLRELSLPNDDLWFAAMRTTPPVTIRLHGKIRSMKIHGPRLSRRNLRGRNDQIIAALHREYGNCPWS